MNSNIANKHRKRGFTLIELVIVIAAIGILIGLFLPATRRVNFAKRRTHCANNVRQIVRAMHDYESTHQYLPPAVGTFDTSGRWVEGGEYQTSAFVALLPYLNESNYLLNDIADELDEDLNGEPFIISVSPEDRSFSPWQTRIPELQCWESYTDQDGLFQQTSYAFSIGDIARNIMTAPRRGAFTVHSKTHLSDFIDGTSSTIMLTEVCPSKPVDNSGIAIDGSADFLENPILLDQYYNFETNRFKKSASLLPTRRGSNWADGAAAATLANTILPPNSASFVVNEDRFSDGLYSVASGHKSIVITGFADGSVQNINKTIDAGSMRTRTFRPNEHYGPSPHGVWGALGSLNGGEVIEDY